MWAFLNLGILAELLFGRRSFVLLYLYCALGGSIASVWWHAAVVGVGASGAIFGIAGALLPALAFQRNQRLRAAMRGNLTSIALFVFYNIAFGAAMPRTSIMPHTSEGSLPERSWEGCFPAGRCANLNPMQCPARRNEPESCARTWLLRW